MPRSGLVSIRRFTMDDLQQMQQINLQCLPENYTLKYWLEHIVEWPEITYVATVGSHVVGYIMGKIDDGHGHITSVAVLNDYRCMGIAHRLMKNVLMNMKDCYHIKYCTLHVRESNFVAIHLYHDLCGFTEREVDPHYFADGEDAWKMTCKFE